MFRGLPELMKIQLTKQKILSHETSNKYQLPG